MTDAEFDQVIIDLGLYQRRKVVRSLLAGNDAQCFTTRQYVESYHRICHNDNPENRENWLKWLTELVPQHMKSVGAVEVHPGVWTLKNLQATED